jgi:hypothetical protein
MANMNRSLEPFDRKPIERGYRISGLAGAIPVIADSGDLASSEMEIRNLAAAIQDEASALIGELEKADQSTAPKGG